MRTTWWGQRSLGKKICRRWCKGREGKGEDILAERQVRWERGKGSLSEQGVWQLRGQQHRNREVEGRGPSGWHLCFVSLPGADEVKGDFWQRLRECCTDCLRSAGDFCCTCSEGKSNLQFTALLLCIPGTLHVSAWAEYMCVLDPGSHQFLRRV